MTRRPRWRRNKTLALATAQLDAVQKEISRQEQEKARLREVISQAEYEIKQLQPSKANGFVNMTDEERKALASSLTREERWDVVLQQYRLANRALGAFGLETQVLRNGELAFESWAVCSSSRGTLCRLASCGGIGLLDRCAREKAKPAAAQMKRDAQFVDPNLCAPQAFMKSYTESLYLKEATVPSVQDALDNASGGREYRY
jgi:hypothetical protein